MNAFHSEAWYFVCDQLIENTIHAIIIVYYLE